MKIKVNKEASDKRFNEVVEEIIRTAELTAQNGLDKFYYPLIRGEVFSSFEVCEKVEELTEETVYCPMFYDDSIIFRIR